MRTIFLSFVTIIYSFSQAQVLDNNNKVVDDSKSKVVAPYAEKGKFHIAIQDFTFGITTGQFTLSSLSVRAGYSITNRDIAFLSWRYTWNPRSGYSDALETEIFYRHYFTEKQFQPFLQVGTGVGYIKYAEENDYKPDHKFYGTIKAGAGIAFRYKRWRFELGIQSGYNQYSTARISIAPIVGVSFYF
jgi:hypothetical protein